MMKDGRPFTDENGWKDDSLIDDMNSEDAETARAWIRARIIPRKTVNMGCSSYGIKHLMQNETGLYMTNNQFKDAMLSEGYLPVNPKELNWHYRIMNPWRTALPNKKSWR